MKEEPEGRVEEEAPGGRVKIRIAKPADVKYVYPILREMEASAKVRGTGIAKRTPQALCQKIYEGKAVIAIIGEDGEWAGFSYIEAWGNGEFVSNSGLIVNPAYRGKGVARGIKAEIVRLSRSLYPAAKIFSITTGAAVMKLNHEFGFRPVMYAEITRDEQFWDKCRSCVNYGILQSQGRQRCLCTAMLWEPEKAGKMKLQIKYMIKRMMISSGMLLFGCMVFGQSAVTDTTVRKVKRDTVLRSLPSPLPQPPFPTADWDGAPLVGVDATPENYPLQKALGLTKSKVKIYGWASIGGNLSSSKNSNAPESYDLVPNSVQLDQVALQITRQPNTAQTDHFDWGFLSTTIFGTDYRYTAGKGYFSDQLLVHNNLYGFDPAEAYALLYFPKIADGMILKVGRYISPADIEAQWAPNNYLFSHSLMFTVDPYTFTGVQATFKLGSYWQLEVGAHAGNDMAPWSNSAQLNGLLMARWVSKNNNNSLYGGINSLGNGDYKNGHDDLQMVVMTWGHKFNETFHMMTEAYYMWQYHALTGGTVINGPAKGFDEGVGPGNLIPGAATTQGLVNYFQILLNKANYFSIRNDMLNDPQANRTGFATLYTSHTIGFVHFFGEYFTVRPEVRYERAYAAGMTPYDNGTKKDQWTAAADLIVRF